jgi:hypothetical protein
LDTNDLGHRVITKNIPDINIRNCYIRVIHKRDALTLIFVKNETIPGLTEDDDNGWQLGNDGYYKGKFDENFRLISKEYILSSINRCLFLLRYAK